MKVKMNRQQSGIKSKIKLNPFEVHINRSKHQVLGRKLKSDKGMPGISKHKAFKKRKDTLLQEYKMRHKTNHFIDQRIGERNSDMTEDDRIMARFTAERMRMFNKKTMFNLADTEVLTHRGQTLSEIERFEDIRSDDEDDDDLGKSGALKGKFVGDAHFGGGMLTKNKKDRESLIDELINESKKRKAERQRNKEETLEATEKLDEEWKILGQITTSAGVEDQVSEPVNKTKEDSYDVVMRQLKFEPHGQASQRLKTDEEIAKEDKEKLEKLEHERLKQLREIEAIKFGNHRSSDDIDDGFTDLTNDFLADDEDMEGSSESSPESDADVDNVTKCSISDERYSDSNTDSQMEKARKVISNKKELKFSTENLIEQNVIDYEGTTQLICDSNFSSGDESGDESSGDECAMEDLTDLMPTVNEKQFDNEQQNNTSIKSNKLSKESKAMKESQNIKNSTLSVTVDLDLPYVLDVPDNYNSFKDLLNKHSIEQQNLIFERLLKSNHPSLDPLNRKKILKLVEYIIQFVNGEEFTLDTLPNMVLHFSILKGYINEECLKLLIDSLLLKVDDFNDNSSSEGSIKFLIFYVLLFLKPQGMDVLLPINKPALSLLTKVVSQNDAFSTSQIKVSLLCCYILLQDAKSSSTVYTDAITFLQNCLESSISGNSDPTCGISKKQIGSHEDNIKTLIDLNSNDNLCEELKLFLKDSQGKDCDCQVLYLSVIFIAEFIKIYRKYPQSKIMFKSTHSNINKIDTSKYPTSVKKSVEDLKILLETLQTATLPPVVKATKKPKALRQYEPSFHVITEGKRSLKGLPVEKQEEQKLLHKYKHEMKGAMRELRRDRVFLANVKLGEKARSDAERIKKVKEIFGAASAQQGELRSLKRKK